MERIFDLRPADRLTLVIDGQPIHISATDDEGDARLRIDAPRSIPVIRGEKFEHATKARA